MFLLPFYVLAAYLAGRLGASCKKVLIVGLPVEVGDVFL